MKDPDTLTKGLRRQIGGMKKAPYRDNRAAGNKRPVGRKICICDCGGTVRGIRDFGRWFTYCDTCTPVKTIRYSTS